MADTLLISEFISPHNFYVVSVNEERIEKMNNLIEELSTYASRFMSNLRDNCHNTGFSERQNVLVNTANVWKRGVIMKIVNQEFQVFLVDYGKLENSLEEYIIPLEDDKLIAVVPFGVFRGVLHNVSLDKKQSHFADKFCKVILSNYKCEFILHHTTKMEAFGDIKVITGQETEYMLSDRLVAEGFGTKLNNTNEVPEQESAKQSENCERCGISEQEQKTDLASGKLKIEENGTIQNGTQNTKCEFIVHSDGRCFVPTDGHYERFKAREDERKHHRLARLEQPRLYVQTLMQLRPIASKQEANFTEYVHGNLDKMGISEVFRIQAYSWPLILFGESVMMVNPPKSGKTFAYLPAVCSLVSYPEIKEKEHGLSPTALILAPSPNEVEKIYSSLRKIDHNKELKIIKVAQEHNKSLISKLPNGWDIIIATPALYSKLLQYEHVTSISDLDILVIDDINYASEELITMISSCHNRIKKGELQLIITTEYYNKLSKAIMNCYTLNLLIGAHLESAKYTKVSFKFTITEKVRKITELHKILLQEIHDKILVFCENKAEVLYVSDMLKNLSVVHICAHENTPGHETEHLYAEWNRREPNISTVLICTDDIAIDLDITDANAIIHYNLPSTWSGYAFRYSTMVDNYKPPEEQTKNNCCSYCIMDAGNIQQLPRIISFMEQIGINVENEELKSIVRQEQARRDSEKAVSGLILCEAFMLMGYCPKLSSCTQRHNLIACDEPEQFLPTSGEVKLNMVKVISVNHYIANIIGHRLPGHTEWINVKPKFISSHCSLYYNAYDTDIRAVNPVVGLICAICVANEQFERCKILEIQQYGKYGNALSKANVFLIDNGVLMKNVPVSKLAELPEHLKNEPPSVVHVKLIGIKPQDGCYWNDGACHLLRNIFKFKIAKKESFVAKVHIALASTIWVEDINKVRLSKSKELYLESLKAMILDRHIAVKNPDHSKHLRELYETTSHFQSSKIENNDSIGINGKDKVLPKEYRDQKNESVKSGNDDATYFQSSKIKVKNNDSFEDDGQENNFSEEGKDQENESAESVNDDQVVHQEPDAIETTNNMLPDLTENKMSKLISEVIVLEKNHTYDVYLSCAESMSAFYVRLISSRKSVDEMTNAIQVHMADIDNNLVLINAQPGEYCLAQSSDQTYSRAKIINVFPAEYRVFFVDFGDHATVSTVYDINNLFCGLPQQAIKCRLYDCEVSDNNQDEAIDILYDHSEVSWSAEIAEIAKDEGCHLVHIEKYSENDTISINEEILKLRQPNKELSAIISKPPKDTNSLIELVSSLKFEDDIEENSDYNGSESCFDIVNLADLLKTGLEHKQKTLKSLPKAKTETNYAGDLPAPEEPLECSSENAASIDADKNKISYEEDLPAPEEPLECSTKNVAPIDDLPILKPIYKIPNIIWNQDEQRLKITILLPGVQEYSLKLCDRNIFFKGIVDSTEYGFSLNLFGYIVPQLSEHYKTGQHVQITCIKHLRLIWPVLNYYLETKPYWVLNGSHQDYNFYEKKYVGSKLNSCSNKGKYDGSELFDMEEISHTENEESSDSEIGEEVFDVLS